MMTIRETIQFLKEHDIAADEMTLNRWIRERRIIAIGSAESRDWQVTRESLIYLILDELRKENARLHDLLSHRMQYNEEPPF